MLRSHARIAACGFALAVGCRSAPGQVANPNFEVEQGWVQGATLELGAGRMAMFGEAAMFTSQVVGDGPPVGLDHRSRSATLDYCETSLAG